MATMLEMEVTSLGLSGLSVVVKVENMTIVMAGSFSYSGKAISLSATGVNFDGHLDNNGYEIHGMVTIANVSGSAGCATFFKRLSGELEIFKKKIVICQKTQKLKDYILRGTPLMY